MLFAEWYRLCELPGANDAAYSCFVVQLQQSGLLKGDDTTDSFFRHIMVNYDSKIFMYFKMLCRSLQL